MSVEVIIPAAGIGQRLNSDQPKPFVEINHKPLFIYSLEVFEKMSEISSVIVVSHPDRIDDFQSTISQYKLTKVKSIVAGGATRSESVYNGLAQVNEMTEYVIVHDAARPCITPSIIQEALKIAEQEGASVVAVPVKPTLKQIDLQTNKVEKTVDRSKIWEVQTPQIFRKALLEKAYTQDNLDQATDDASLVEQMGHSVKVVMGDYKNIKVTTPEDIDVASLFLEKIYEH